MPTPYKYLPTAFLAAGLMLTAVACSDDDSGTGTDPTTDTPTEDGTTTTVAEDTTTESS